MGLESYNNSALMTRFETIKRLYRIHLAIKQENTGNPTDFAKRFRLSRSHLYNIIGELADYGGVVKYDPKKNTMHYVNDFEITDSAVWQDMISLFDKK